MAKEPNENVVFSIVFKKGLADNHRLPLGHVIKTLQQIEKMITEVGKEIQRDAGVENPDGDFGVELLAGKGGLAFKKGSLATAATVTRDIPHGVQAITALIETTDAIQRRSALPLVDHSDEILRRLPRISQLQELDDTELHLKLTQNNQVLGKTKLGEKGRETLRQLESAELGIEGITLYGKLRELKDISRQDEQSGYFWGELLEDNGRTWRIRFRDAQEGRVLKLFRKQVSIVGDATYFKTKTPRVDAQQIDEETVPDYLAAFERIGEVYADVFPDKDVEEILDDIRE